MQQLTSKLQYKNFEAGEFTDQRKRTYEETISEIELFPWNEERDHIVIDLTNPSITIEGENNNYLKLALFSNGKFVLHYLSNEKVLFTKSFTNLKDTYSYIRNFFGASAFDLSDFKKENTWLKNNIVHFVSQDFRYEINSKRIREFIILTSGFNLGSTLFLAVVFLLTGRSHYTTGLMILPIYFFLFGGGINLAMIYSYYKYAKGKSLIMSKGNDIFYFGEIATLKKYDKKDIIQFTTLKLRGSKAPLSGFAIIEIEFKNNEKIIIPSLFIDYNSLEKKLYQYKHIEESGLPYMFNL